MAVANVSTDSFWSSEDKKLLALLTSQLPCLGRAKFESFVQIFVSWATHCLGDAITVLPCGTWPGWT
jgi:hypothetical protein